MNKLRFNQLLESTMGNVKPLLEDIDLMNKPMKKITNSEGITLVCVKLNLEDPKSSESSTSGPYPWNLVDYNKESRPVKLYLNRPKEMVPDRVFGSDEDITISFEEITDPKLKGVITDKKYVMTTTHSPGVTGKQYCRVEKPMDTDWDTNFFSINSSVIDPYPKID